MAPAPTIKLEESRGEIGPTEPTPSSQNIRRKRARADDGPHIRAPRIGGREGTSEDTQISGRVKAEAVPAQPNKCDHCSPEGLARRRGDSEHLRAPVSPTMAR
ncbi:hypothetical protein GGX14DRAFT_391129 [Mycena pura]|uniref:Uncharacterized protein n=1 Tax=Mycena pura TaxID=153505 RepID=A0AAD6YES6_9AGAR|nr:hypothetical protein GGX14DRAFT_391129 [Mycena pura]